MTDNKMFPINLSCKEHYGFMSSKVSESEVWHLRYGHLNFDGLRLLASKNMGKGRPTIKDLDHVCKGCALGKQTRKSFPVGQSRRAEKNLEMVGR